MKILNFENENRKFTKSIENFHVMEYLQDSSVSPMTAMEEYYMSKMNVRRRQVVIELENDELKIDGNLAVCWSSNLDFTVERSAQTLVGSAVSGEGLVNVYRGTGRVLMSPVAPTDSLLTATNTTQANPAVKSNVPPENYSKTRK